MGAKTKISWADSTWPVINGCRRVTEGCRNCYAERLVGTRLKHNEWYAGLTEETPNGPRWTGKWRVNEPHLEDPLKWRDPRWIFPCDRGDLFFEPVPFETIRRVADIMEQAHWHRFLVLTKRPERAAEFARLYPLPSNVWMGTSIHDQASADAALRELARVHARNYFVSFEPALGPVNFKPWLYDYGCPCGWGGGVTDACCDNCGWSGDGEAGEDCPSCGENLDDTDACPKCGNTTRHGSDFGPNSMRLGLVIVGGESDQNFKGRPHELSIPRRVIADCRAAGVPVFNKQLGACPVGDLGGVLSLAHRAGGDPAEWPEDLRVRQMPEFG